MQDVLKSMKALRSEDVANCILYVLSTPVHVQVSQFKQFKQKDYSKAGLSTSRAHLKYYEENSTNNPQYNCTRYNC